ncbi:MAG: hypothetical protein LAT84_03130 [Balneolia bacterium]|nr:hypothetical protein [Balneolia bacterium]
MDKDYKLQVVQIDRVNATAAAAATMLSPTLKKSKFRPQEKTTPTELTIDNSLSATTGDQDFKDYLDGFKAMSAHLTITRGCKPQRS